MRSAAIILLLLGIIISGCLSNPFKQVQVVKVNVTFDEKQGIVESRDLSLVQGTVDYAGRPRRIYAEAFPTIAARAMVEKGKNSTIEPWENVPYKGSGVYAFNLGFKEGDEPLPNQTVHVSIIVLNEKGERIGYVIEDIVWK